MIVRSRYDIKSWRKRGAPDAGPRVDAARRLHEAVVGEEDHAAGAKPTGGLDVFHRPRRRQSVRADARPQRTKAGHLTRRRDLRVKYPPVLRVSHRAHHVEPPVLDP